jgi:steroid delta-isomerase-like uncharacterized protein
MTDAVTIARRWFQAHDAIDYPALEAVLHPDVEVRSLFRQQPARGRPEALEHFREMMARYPDLLLRIEVGPVAAGADSGGTRVFASVVFTGHYVGDVEPVDVADGRQLAVPGAVELHVEDGHVRTVRTYFDKAEWLAQIGAPVPS